MPKIAVLGPKTFHVLNLGICPVQIANTIYRTFGNG